MKGLGIASQTSLLFCTALPLSSCRNSPRAHMQLECWIPTHLTSRLIAVLCITVCSFPMHFPVRRKVYISRSAMLQGVEFQHKLASPGMTNEPSLNFPRIQRYLLLQLTNQPKNIRLPGSEMLFIHSTPFGPLFQEFADTCTCQIHQTFQHLISWSGHSKPSVTFISWRLILERDFFIRWRLILKAELCSYLGFWKRDF